MGVREAALIDPGPDLEGRVRALVEWVSDASSVKILLTHGHRDHTGSAPALAKALEAPIYGPADLEIVERPLEDGDEVTTDAGTLVAVHTPGHVPEHLCYLWTDRRALFAGDLLLGQGDTTWVAGYPGCVADYMASLERVRALAPDVIYPAHGAPLEDPPQTLRRFADHRLQRIRQVEAAVEADPHATPESLVKAVYGPDLPPPVERAALESLGALLEHVREAGSR